MRNEQDEQTVDVSVFPELRRLAEEVQNTGKSLVLRDGNTTLAVVVPFDSRGTLASKRRQPTAQDIAAFRSAAGSWSDVDVDRLLGEIYSARDVPDERPPVKL